MPVEINILNNECKIIMLDKERAITLGQSAVIYQNEECLGGGIIYSLR